MRKEILFIAPLTPPVHGQSRISDCLLKLISEKNNVKVINLSKKSLKSGVFSFYRGLKIIKILFQIRLEFGKSNMIFISLAESFLGNIRDILFLILTRKKAKSIIVHMQGGEEMRFRLTQSFFFKQINRFLLKDIGGVIVEGETNFKLFSNILSKERVHIVPNFSDDYLFISEDQIEKKFKNIQKIQILFLSNFNKGKGHLELLEAFISLPPNYQEKFKLVFVGGFESVFEESAFLSKIASFENVEYRGVITNETSKKEAFHQSHIFCLPTYYPFEGQPISILEAYASGCFVITTNHADIPAIFEENTNGFLVTKKSASSIRDTLISLINNIGLIKKVATQNRDIALEKYQFDFFQQKIKNILKNKIQFSFLLIITQGFW